MRDGLLERSEREGACRLILTVWYVPEVKLRVVCMCRERVVSAIAYLASKGNCWTLNVRKHGGAVSPSVMCNASLS